MAGGGNPTRFRPKRPAVIELRQPEKLAPCFLAGSTSNVYLALMELWDIRPSPTEFPVTYFQIYLFYASTARDYVDLPYIRPQTRSSP